MAHVRQRLLPVLGWLLSVVVATTVGLIAVSLLSAGITSSSTTPLSHDAVARALASTAPTPSQSSSPATASVRPTASSTPGRPHSLSSPGGTIIAQCFGEQVYLVSWSPAQGWQVDDQVRGPARSTMVKFERDGDSESDREVTAAISCRSGQPVATNVETDD